MSSPEQIDVSVQEFFSCSRTDFFFIGYEIHKFLYLLFLLLFILHYYILFYFILISFRLFYFICFN